LSLRELWSEFRAARQRRKDDIDRDTMLAWQVMRVFIRSIVKDGYQLPALATLMLGDRKQLAQSPEAQVAMLRHLADQYGLKLTCERHRRRSKWPSSRTSRRCGDRWISCRRR
jgi:hypothetical protein